MDRYTHQKIEKKWQEQWKQDGLYSTRDRIEGKENYYQLVEFPYPSGNLHVGHWYAFAVPDIFARFQRMQGRNVLFPMGFDAFGLPAENAAIKNNLNPRVWTEQNMQHMREQIGSMGNSFDTSREVVTCDPAYYRWTQWLFIQLFKAGLVEQRETQANWCPSCKTVLANEQVVNGHCERCDSEVEKKKMQQWQVGITDYADRLIDDLDELQWPEEIKTSQKNWIGRSEGAEIDFAVQRGDTQPTVKNIVFDFGGVLNHIGSQKEIFEALGLSYEERGDEIEAATVRSHIEMTDDAYDMLYTRYGETVTKDAFIGALITPNTKMLDFVRQLHAQGYQLYILSDISQDIISRFLRENKLEELFSGVVESCAVGHMKPSKEIFEYLLQKYSLDPSQTVFIDDRERNTAGAQKHGMSAVLCSETTQCISDIKMHIEATTTIPVFTTRPDTLYGVTYMVLAPEGEKVQELKNAITNWVEVEKCILQAKKKTEIDRLNDTKEKTGVKLEGVSAINPANGEEIPIYIADYVLANYGTGAIMAVPAHDERDFAFAQKYDIPITQVIVPIFVDPLNLPQKQFDEVKRDTVFVFLRDKDTGKYALLEWKQELTGVVSVITGGIDEGETAEEAVRKEVAEETGFEDIEIVKKVPWITDARYCAAHKKENRLAVGHTFLCEVDSLTTQQEITPEEKEKHDVVWVSEKEMNMRITPVHQQFLWTQIQKETSVAVAGRLMNSGAFDGMISDEAKKTITQKVGGKMTKTYKLRDWGVSRQRYWGCPIPIITCAKCGPVAVPDEQLPVELPDVEDYLPNDEGQSPLAKAQAFVNVTCPTCGSDAKRETDTLDTFVDSSWYFLRYCDPMNTEVFADKEKMDAWTPVDRYSGGAEHTTMHLLYSRFFTKALYDLGLVSESEPYTQRLNRGLIMGTDGNKMSKSKGNVINPDDIIEKLGADTMRIYLAFIGPYNEVGSYPWNPESIIGVRRFVERVWRLRERLGEGTTENMKALHMGLQKITDSISEYKMNTGVASLMTAINALEKAQSISREEFELFIKMLSPYAPHIAEELWRGVLGEKESVHLQTWPEVDNQHLVDDEITLVVQVNGKVRDKITVAAHLDDAMLESVALASEKIIGVLDGKKIKKVIVVKGKLVSIVV